MDATALAHFDVKSTSPGKEVAWIGPPGSERPAAVTRISASAAARNAGGLLLGAAALVIALRRRPRAEAEAW